MLVNENTPHLTVKGERQHPASAYVWASPSGSRDDTAVGTGFQEQHSRLTPKVRGHCSAPQGLPRYRLERTADRRWTDRKDRETGLRP